jgi:hypothetical protein
MREKSGEQLVSRNLGGRQGHELGQRRPRLASRLGGRPHPKRYCKRDSRGYLRHRRSPGLNRRRDHRLDRATDHAALGLPHRRLRGWPPREPPGAQARAARTASGPGGDAGAGDHRRSARSKFHRSALRHHAATRSAAERPAGSPAAGVGHDPDGLGRPRLALPVHRWGHRWPLGSENRQP